MDKTPCDAPLLRKPSWLRIQLGGQGSYAKVRATLEREGLHTICTSGRCPNQGECWNEGTATFMILGDRCTRNCRFCATSTGHPLPPDPQETRRVVRSVQLLALRHVVLTSVDRDDLPDGGASQWVELIEALRAQCPHTTIETLPPDFKGKQDALERVIAAHPDIIAHNIETVARLTPDVRSKATYNHSLQVLQQMADSGLVTKSGLMLGLGENEQEVRQTISDLYRAGCKVLTIGQYLQPRIDNWPVARYVTPAEFEDYKSYALALGFRYVASGPLVRSSFHAVSALKACGLGAQ